MKIVVVGSEGVVGSALCRYFMIFDNEVIRNDLKPGNNVHSKLENCIGNEDFIFVCVPTPSKEDGTINLDYVESVTHEIGRICRDKKHNPNIVYKSTILPGSTEEMKEILLTYGFMPNVAFNPEFLRERYAFFDTLNPSRIVVGSDNVAFATRVMELYGKTDAPKFIFSSFEAAELLKYYANCYYAARISFFNQMKEYADRFGCDHDKIVKAIVVDKSIGVHGSNPTGKAYSNKCLPKDLIAMIRFGESIGINCKLLKSVKDINDRMICRERFKDKDLSNWL
jgi:UDPglucose 6-dehydrogenase